MFNGLFTVPPCGMFRNNIWASQELGQKASADKSVWANGCPVDLLVFQKETGRHVGTFWRAICILQTFFDNYFVRRTDTHTHSRSFCHFTLLFSVTHFICFTMVLLPDSPAPGKRTKVLPHCHTFHCQPIGQPLGLHQFTLWPIRNQTTTTVWKLGTFRPIKHINSAVASTYTTVQN